MLALLQQSDDEIRDALFSFDFDWAVLAYNLSLIAAAFVLALPIGWDREQRRSSPGLRTFPLVAISSCAYLLVAHSAIGEADASLARVLQGLAIGIGFIGGGAILKSENHVRGTATAAAIWTVGAMGAAVALRRMEIAIVLSVATFGTLRWLAPFKATDDSR